MKISSDNSQEYFKILPRTKRHKRRSVPSVPRFRTPTSSPNNKCKSPLIPAARSGGSPASPPAKAESMEYSYWSSQSYTYKTNPTNYGTYQETEPNLNNSIITIQRLHLRKSTRQEQRATLSNTSFNLHNVVIYTISKMSPGSGRSVEQFRSWTFSSTHIK